MNVHYLSLYVFHLRYKIPFGIFQSCSDVLSIHPRDSGNRNSCYPAVPHPSSIGPANTNMQIICKCAGPWQFHIYLLGWLLPLVSCSCTYTFYNLVSRSCSRAVLDSVPNSIFLLNYDVLNSKLHFKQLKLCLKKISQPTFYQKGKCGDYIFLQFYTYNDFYLLYLFFILFVSKPLINSPSFPALRQFHNSFQAGL